MISLVCLTLLSLLSMKCGSLKFKFVRPWMRRILCNRLLHKWALSSRNSESAVWDSSITFCKRADFLMSSLTYLDWIGLTSNFRARRPSRSYFAYVVVALVSVAIPVLTKLNRYANILQWITRRIVHSYWSWILIFCLSKVFFRLFSVRSDFSDFDKLDGSFVFNYREWGWSSWFSLNSLK